MATEGRFDEYELEWMADVLDQHGEFVADILQEAIEDKELKVTEHLKDSISFKAHRLMGTPGLSISFDSVGRFIEIRYHKSKNRSLLSEISANHAKVKSIKRNQKKKDTRWYAKNVYGSLNRLIGILMYEFTDQERNRIKGILEKRKIRQNELKG